MLVYIVTISASEGRGVAEFVVESTGCVSMVTISASEGRGVAELVVESRQC